MKCNVTKFECSVTKFECSVRKFEPPNYSNWLARLRITLPANSDSPPPQSFPLSTHRMLTKVNKDKFFCAMYFHNFVLVLGQIRRQGWSHLPILNYRRKTWELEDQTKTASLAFPWQAKSNKTIHFWSSWGSSIPYWCFEHRCRSNIHLFTTSKKSQLV